MAADNQAQSVAITQISAAIGAMDRSTQQNAAMVEQTSAAARNLVGEVTNLSEQARRFNTVSDIAHHPRKVAPAFAVRSYASPVKPLPAAAIPALVWADAVHDEWKEF